MSIETRNRRIIALAQAGNRPQLIASVVGCTDDVVYNVIHDARAAGLQIDRLPLGPSGPRVQPADDARARPLADKPVAKPAPRWTMVDDAELRRLHGLGIGVTRIAAQLRKPYRMVIEAAERLSLYETRETSRVAS